MAAKNHSDFNVDTRLALLEQTNSHIYDILNKIDKRFDKIDERFDKIDERFNRMEDRFDKVDEKFDKVDEKFDKMNNKIDHNFYILLTLYLGGYASLFAMMAKIAHWY